MNRGILGLAVLALGLYALTNLENAEKVTRPALAAGNESQQSAKGNQEQFIATVDNEYNWRSDLLPVDWPKFTVVPGKQALAAKTTDQKLDIARSVQEKFQAFKDKKSSAPPTSKDTGLAIDYLLSIQRSDPQFSQAWAFFIKARIADRAAGEYERDIAARKKRGVNVGMTSQEVLQSNWGKPEKVNETITARGKHEQWVYGYNYLYFENGILTSIQTSR